MPEYIITNSKGKEKRYSFPTADAAASYLDYARQNNLKVDQVYFDTDNSEQRFPVTKIELDDKGVVHTEVDGDIDRYLTDRNTFTDIGYGLGQKPMSEAYREAYSKGVEPTFEITEGNGARIIEEHDPARVVPREEYDPARLQRTVQSVQGLGDRMGGVLSDRGISPIDATQPMSKIAGRTSSPIVDKATEYASSEIGGERLSAEDAARMEESPEYRDVYWNIRRKYGMTPEEYATLSVENINERIEEALDIAEDLREEAIADQSNWYVDIHGNRLNAKDDQIKATIRAIKRAQRDLNDSRTKYGEKDGWHLGKRFWDGGELIAKLTPIYNMISSLESAGVTMGQAMAAGKMIEDPERLTPEQQMLLSLTSIQQSVAQYQQDMGGKHWASGAGEVLQEMPEFMMGMPLAKLATKAVTKGATKGLAKLAGKAIAETAEEATETAAETIARRALDKATGWAKVKQVASDGIGAWGKSFGEAAIGAPTQTLFYRSLADEALGQYQVRPDGSAIQQVTPAWERVYRAWLGTALELHSEDMGMWIGKGLNALGRRMANVGFVRGLMRVPAARSPLMEVVRKELKVADPLSEALGEVYGDAIQPLFTGDLDWSQTLADPDYWLTTVVSSAGVSVAMELPSIMQFKRDADRVNKYGMQMDYSLAVMGEDLRGQLVAAVSHNSIEAQTKALANIDWKNVSRQDMAAAMDYVNAYVGRELYYNSYREAERQTELQRQMNNLLALSYRGESGYGNTMTAVKATAKPSSGLSLVDEYYIISGDYTTQQGARMLNVMRVGKDGVVREVAFADQLNIGEPIDIADQLAKQYDLMFGEELAREGVVSISQRIAQMRAEGVNEETIREVVSEDPAYHEYKEGDVVTDNQTGEPVTINEQTSTGEYIATKSSGERIAISYDQIADSGAYAEQAIERERTSGGVKEGDVVSFLDRDGEMVEGAVQQILSDGRIYVSVQTGENNGVPTYATQEITPNQIIPAGAQPAQPTPTEQVAEEVVADVASEVQATEQTAPAEVPIESQPAEVASTADPRAIPTLEDGSIDYDAIEDPQQLLDLYSQDLTPEEIVEDITSMRDQSAANAERLSAEVATAQTLDEKKALRTQAKAEAAKVYKYQAVLDLLTPATPIAEQAEAAPTVPEVAPVAAGVSKFSDLQKTIDRKAAAFKAQQTRKARPNPNVKEINALYPDGIHNMPPYIRALAAIATGTRFVWNSRGPKRGIGAELGFLADDGERKVRIGILARAEKGGVYFDEFVERLWHNEDGNGGEDIDDVRNAVIDALRDANSPTKAMQILRESANKNAEPYTEMDQEDFDLMVQYNQEQATLNQIEEDDYYWETTSVTDEDLANAEKIAIEMWLESQNNSNFVENLQSYDQQQGDTASNEADRDISPSESDVANGGVLMDQGSPTADRGDEEPRSAPDTPDGARGVRETRAAATRAAQIEQRVAEIDAQLEAKRKEYNSTKQRIGKEYNADQPDLFGSSDNQLSAASKGGVLFDVQGDYSKQNISSILSYIQADIDRLESEKANLLNTKETSIAQAVEAERLQAELDISEEQPALSPEERAAQVEDPNSVLFTTMLDNAYRSGDARRIDYNERFVRALLNRAVNVDGLKRLIQNQTGESSDPEHNAILQRRYAFIREVATSRINDIEDEQTKSETAEPEWLQKVPADGRDFIPYIKVAGANKYSPVNLSTGSIVGLLRASLVKREKLQHLVEELPKLVYDGTYFQIRDTKGKIYYSSEPIESTQGEKKAATKLTTLKTVSGAEVRVPINLYKYVSTDKTRAYTGVYFDPEGFVVATDAFNIVVIKHNVTEADAEKFISKAGDVAPSVFNWRGASMDPTTKRSANIDFTKAEKQIGGKKGNKSVIFNIDGEDVGFPAKAIHALADFQRAFGGEVFIGDMTAGKAIMISSGDNYAMALQQIGYADPSQAVRIPIEGLESAAPAAEGTPAVVESVESTAVETPTEPTPKKSKAKAKSSEDKIEDYGEGIVRARRSSPLEDSKSLIGLHNISEEKLRKALKIGGLANPSVAIIDTNTQHHTGYGDISFVLPSSLVEKKTGRNIGTFFGDAWTPVYPEVQRQFGKKGSKKASQDIAKLPDEMQGVVRLGLNSWLDGRNGDGLQYMFLYERGNAPELYRQKPQFSEELRSAVIEATDKRPFYNLTSEQRQQVLDLYIQERYNGDKTQYDEHLQRVRNRSEKVIQERGENSLVGRKAKEVISTLDEYGYDYESVSGFLRDILNDINTVGVIDPQYTELLAENKIRDERLEDEYGRWLSELVNRYDVKEVIFKGYTPLGNRRYVPHTLENVSKEMREQGRNGATGLGLSFTNFAAKLLKPEGKLSDIRKRKGQLRPTYEEVEAFKEKWSKVFYDLGVKLQPNAPIYEDYGLHRLAEAATMENPNAYLKKEYGVELSANDVQLLKDMVKAIQTEYPVMYFETKFERPVYFNEFAGVVIPNNTSEDIKQALSEQDLNVIEYAANDENARANAIKAIAELDENKGNVLFQRGDFPEMPNTEANRRAYKLIREKLRKKGIEVHEVSEEMANAMASLIGAEFATKRKSAPETESPQNEDQPSVVSSADGAKILKNLDSTIQKYVENAIKRPNTFLGDVAKAIKAKKQGSGSQYATFEAINGKVFTIRLADHNAKASTFDNHNEKEGISIIITESKNGNLINDGNAHIVEYYYDAVKLRKESGLPLVEILKSIKQALYSGEYKDTTKLAKVQEINADNAKNYVIFNESDLKIIDRVELFQDSQGKIYGWAVGGEIYLTPDGLNANTAIHEYSHLWVEALRKKDSKKWSEIKSQLQATPFWQQVIDDPNYERIRENEDAVASEVLARLTGKNGAERLAAEAQRIIDAGNGSLSARIEATALVQRIKRLLRDLWAWVARNIFGVTNEATISQLSDMVVDDLLDETPLTDAEGSPFEAMFIGELGANVLDIEQKVSYRMANMDVAMQMEQAGKSPFDIKIATGWERGADGEWRYEISDAEAHLNIEAMAELNQRLDSGVRQRNADKLRQFEHNNPSLAKKRQEMIEKYSINSSAVEALDEVFELTPVVAEFKLRDLFDYDEAYEAYPQLMNTRVRVIDGMRSLGAHWGDNIDISLEVAQIPARMRGTLLHEIQHSIQSIEGFAAGGNKEVAQELMREMEQEVLIFDFAGLVRGELRENPDLTDRQVTQKVISELKERTGLTREELESTKRIPTTKQRAEAIAAARNPELYEYYWGVFQMFNAALDDEGNIDSMKAYRNLMGEVEARNTTSRRNMAAEQRRSSLGSTTEDVNRGVQIYRSRQGDDSESLSEESKYSSRVEALSAVAYDVAAKLNAPIRVITDMNDVPRARQSWKGWWQRGESGEQIVVVVPNNIDTADIERTILHEAVAHYGLRKLLGESQFNLLLDTVLKSMTEEEAQQRMRKYGTNDPMVVADEYIAEVAEGNVTPSMFERVVSAVRAFLRDVLGLSVQMTDNDIRYLLWQSKNALEGKSAFGRAMVMAQGKPLADMVAEEYGYARAYTAEEQQIIDDAQRNGTYLKAPNGKPTNLTPKQWVQVRTEAFKRWFGDWEKAIRIERLRNSNPIEVAYSGQYELTRKSAKEWLKNNIKGEYINTDTNERIVVSNVGIDEVTSHGSQSIEHLKSLSAIPQMIGNAIFIDELPNNKDHDKYDSYRYYVCGLKIDGVDYTAKIVVGVKGDSKYYDHRLTEIEKGNLIDNLNGLSNSVAENQDPLVSVSKDTKLNTLLQINSSKIVDANGEPLVVEHSTWNEDFYTFNIERLGESSGDEGLYGAGFYFGNVGHTQLYGDRAIRVYLDAKNPLVLPEDNIMKSFDYLIDNFDKEGLRDIVVKNGKKSATLGKIIDVIKEVQAANANGEYDELIEQMKQYWSGAEDRVIEQAIFRKVGFAFYRALTPFIDENIGRREFSKSLQAAGYDGVIFDNREYVVYNPTQIKSAEINSGEFDPTDPDIRARRKDFLDAEGNTTKATPMKQAKEVKPEREFRANNLFGRFFETFWRYTGASQVVAGKTIDGLVIKAGEKELARRIKKGEELLRKREAPFVSAFIKKKIGKGDAMAAFQKLSKADKLQLSKVITGFNPVVDYMSAENRSESQGEYALKKYFDGFIAPLNESRRRMREVMGVSDQELETYVSGESSLERHNSGTDALSTDETKAWSLKKVEGIVTRFRSRLRNNMELQLKQQGANALSEAEKELLGEDLVKKLTEAGYDSLSAGEQMAACEAPVEVLWERIRALNNEHLNILLRAGRYSHDDIERIKSHDWRYYVPMFKQDLNVEGLIDPAAVYDVDIFYGTPSAPSLKPALGRDTKSQDVFRSMYQLGQRCVVFEVRNRVARSLYDFTIWANDHLGLFETRKYWHEGITYQTKTASGKWVDEDTMPSREEREQMLATQREIATLNRERLDIARQINRLSSQIEEVHSEQAADLIDDALRGLVNRKEEILQKIVKLEADRKWRAKKSNFDFEDPTSAQAIERERTVRVWIDGREHRIVFADPDIARAVNGNKNGIVKAIEALGRLVGPFTRFRAQMNTQYSPDFIVSNTLRDYQHALLAMALAEQSDITLSFAGNYFRHLGDVFRSRGINYNPLSEAELKGRVPYYSYERMRSAYIAAKVRGEQITEEDFDHAYRDEVALNRIYLEEVYGKARVRDTFIDAFQRYGGATGFIHQLNSKQIEKQLREAMLLKEDVLARRYVDPTTPFRLIRDVISRVSESMEDITRFATFMAHLDHGASVERAAQEAKEVTTNFNRRGELATGLGSLYMFFNASVQGSAQVMRLIKQHPRRAAAVLPLYALLGFMQRITRGLLWKIGAATGIKAFFFDDDDEERPRTEDQLGKEKAIRDYMYSDNLIIVLDRTLDATDTALDGIYLRIPQPNGFRAAYKVGVELAEVAMGEQRWDELPESLISTLAGEFVYGFGDTGELTSDMWRMVIPSAVQPISDLLLNKDFVNRTIYNEREYNPIAPAYTVAKSNTPSLYIDASRILNSIGGTDTRSADYNKRYEKRAIGLDVPPEAIKYLVGEMFGGVGTFANRMWTTVELMTDGEKGNLAKRDIPFANRVIGGFEPENVWPKYKSLTDQIEAAWSESSGFRAEQGIDMRKSEWKDPDVTYPYLIEHYKDNPYAVEMLRKRWLLDPYFKEIEDYTKSLKRLGEGASSSDRASESRDMSSEAEIHEASRTLTEKFILELSKHVDWRAATNEEVIEQVEHITGEIKGKNQ